MNILYHLPILPPHMPASEALSQEIQALREYNGGELIYVNPNTQSRFYIPRLFFGLSLLKTLRAREASLNLHHFYNADPFPFPYLLRLKRPVIYTITSGIGTRRIPTPYLNRLAAVTVYDERSQQQLTRAGVHRVHLIPPGIDTRRFTCTPLPLEDNLRLLVASAPWTRAQFRSKGIEALLEAAQQEPFLHLTCLWRGVLAEEMARRVAARGLNDRVAIIDRLVDINAVLAQVHATVALATAPGIIKAYPHSLLDSLAAGKPVLVSRTIPMADYVEHTSCGKVVETISPISILNAIAALVSEYENLQTTAQIVGQRDFSLPDMIESYQLLYQKMLEKKFS